MAVAASLNVLLTAQTAAFTRSMQKAEKTLTSFGKAGNAIASVSKAFKVLAAALAVKQIAGFVADGLQSVETMQNLAHQLGMTAEQLRGFQHAAEQNGASAEVMDSALQKMNVVLGEARNGSESAQKALDDLGLSSLYLTNVSPAEAFMQLNQAINGIEDPMRRAAAVQEIFGRGAAELAGVLGLSQEEMIAYQKEAFKLAGGLGKDQIAGITAANDATDRLSRAWEGFKNILAAYVAPWLEKVSNFLTDILLQLYELIGFDEPFVPPATQPAVPITPPTSVSEGKKFIPAANAIDFGSQADRLLEFKRSQLQEGGGKQKEEEKQTALLQQNNRLLERLIGQQPIEFTV